MAQRDEAAIERVEDILASTTVAYVITIGPHGERQSTAV